MFKGYVINLDRQPDRLARFYQQAGSENFIRFPAIDKHTLALIGNPSLLFNTEKAKTIMNRPITWGEIACTLSHISCWEKIANDDSIQDNDFCVVAEDDIQFIPTFTNSINTLINGIRNVRNEDLIILQKLGIYDPIWKEKHKPMETISILKYTDNVDILYSHDGASLYLIRKSLAKSLLSELIDKKPYWLADGFSEFHPHPENIAISIPLLGYAPQDLQSSDLGEDRIQAQQHVINKEKGFVF